MAHVETARGMVEVDSLGTTLMHEHIFNFDAEFEANYPGRWSEFERIDEAVGKLHEAEKRGVCSLVDATVIGLGRYVSRIKTIAERTSINIIVATGIYAIEDIPNFIKLHGPGLLIDDEPLIPMFTRDLTVGIGDTGVRAGIIKCTSDRRGLTAGIERVMRAAAKVHLQTMAPITTHSDPHSQGGLDQQRVLREEGVDLRNVIVGHSGDSTDLDYLRRLMDAGSTIGMDRFGLDMLLPFASRVETVAQLCQQGYAERMVLSHDASCFTHSYDDQARQRLMPNSKYTHLFDDVLPALRDRGVTDSQIDQMLVLNPRRIFASAAR